jgi:hypothetical protein
MDDRINGDGPYGHTVAELRRSSVQCAALKEM